jgi:hypothetical protein
VNIFWVSFLILEWYRHCVIHFKLIFRTFR